MSLFVLYSFLFLFCSMYEKNGEFDKSLNDITVVLALDSHHVRAITRKARICEAQGNFGDALDEYVLVMFIEQAKGQPPTTTDKADEVCKKLAANETAALLAHFRNPPAGMPIIKASLPTKSYCRNFLESLPYIYKWRSTMKNADRDELLSQWKAKLTEVLGSGAEAHTTISENDNNKTDGESVDHTATEASGNGKGKRKKEKKLKGEKDENKIGDANEKERSEGEAASVSTVVNIKSIDKKVLSEFVSSAVALARCDLSHNVFSRGFETVGIAMSAFKDGEEIPEGVDKQIMAELLMLRGIEHLLRRNNSAALATARKATELAPDNIDAALVLATIHLELIEHDQAEAIYTQLLSTADVGSAAAAAATTAWILVHRASLWVTRDTSGGFRPDAVSKAMKDIDSAMSITGR